MSTVDDYATLISDKILSQGVSVSPSKIDEAIESLRLSPSTSEYVELIAKVTAQLSGYGELEPLISNHTTDILVNSPSDIWKSDRDGMQRAAINLKSEQHVRRLASRLALAGRQRLDEALPYVDALLPDGVRLHAIIPPLALHHTSLSLRFPTHRVIDLQDWIEDSKFGVQESSLLQRVAQGEVSALICGTTGAGKTALLRSILSQRPCSKRLIIIEDVSELNIQRPNTVQLQARQPNTEGIGYVSAQTLVRQSLRMRPDSIVIGEIRGAEVVDFLLAISSGHSGSISTIHAHDVDSIKNRIALLAQVAGFDRTFAIDLFNESIDVVLQVEFRAGKRSISRIELVHE